MAEPGALRALPSVQSILETLDPETVHRFPRALIVREIRAAVAAGRGRLAAGHHGIGPQGIAAQVMRNLAGLEQPSLRPVINATGVILHTNLGRAPLGSWRPIAGYSNLEYDLAAGSRGRRDTHLHQTAEALFGSPILAVNNGAAATLLAANELAAGGEVLISRGEIVEIGDGFRIAEIVARSGAALREVGSTNRTSLDDYRAALTPETRMVLRVHPSNFHVTGFTAKPSLRELAAFAKQRQVPLYEDLGSGNVVDLKPFGVREPLVSESLEAGVDLVSFSGDKLLGGPQAGILAGEGQLLARLRRNPLFRALRLDKTIYQALEETLRNLLLERWDRIPALQMIRMSAGEIGERARRLFPRAQLIGGQSLVGGGSTPDQSIPTILVVAAETNAAEAEKRLRSQPVPVIARIEDGRLLLDLRTVFPAEEDTLQTAVGAIAPGSGTIPPCN